MAGGNLSVEPSRAQLRPAPGSLTGGPAEPVIFPHRGKMATARPPDRPPGALFAGALREFRVG